MTTSPSIHKNEQYIYYLKPVQSTNMGQSQSQTSGMIQFFIDTFFDACSMKLNLL